MWCKISINLVIPSTKARFKHDSILMWCNFSHSSWSWSLSRRHLSKWRRTDVNALITSQQRHFDVLYWLGRFKHLVVLYRLFCYHPRLRLLYRERLLITAKCHWAKFRLHLFSKYRVDINPKIQSWLWTSFKLIFSNPYI